MSALSGLAFPDAFNDFPLSRALAASQKKHGSILALPLFFAPQLARLNIHTSFLEDVSRPIAFRKDELDVAFRVDHAHELLLGLISEVAAHLYRVKVGGEPLLEIACRLQPSPGEPKQEVFERDGVQLERGPGVS